MSTALSTIEAPDTSTLAGRASLFLARSAEAARDWYDEEGNWISPSFPSATRERYWLSFALYAHGNPAFADAVVRKGQTKWLEDGKTFTFDIFHTNIAAGLLVKHLNDMAPDVRRHLEGIVRDGFQMQPGNRRPDFQFHGYNDNMPAKATLGLILGGEVLGDSDAIEHGLWNLRQMRALLTRRGTNHEWNSPTYSPLTIHAMAEIAEHAKNPEARDLAAKIEERLWLDIAARFHPEIGVLAGPYSRAYTVDVLAHLSNAASMLWFVLGDSARPSPMELFNPDSSLVLHHEGDLPFNIAQMCWFAADTYHLPARALELMTRKKYPFCAVVMAEQGDCGPDTVASPIRTETFLDKDYAVGTSSIPFLRGEQAGYYQAIYKQVPQPVSYRDYGTVYHKFIVNDETPGSLQRPADGNGKTYSNQGENGNINSHCHVITLQSEASVLLVSCPRVALGGLENTQEPRRISRLAETIIFPSHFANADEIIVGDRPLKSWSGEVKHGEWIGCRRGRLLIAFRPLAYAPELGEVRINLEKVNNYELIQSVFYKGDARTFSRADLRKVFGGFVAEHASVGEYPSLAAFVEEVSKASFTDQLCTTRRVRYRRPAGVRKALEMEISWSPGAIVPRFAIINGFAPKVDAQVKIDGLTDEDFPFLNEPWVSVPSYFPWEKVEARNCGLIGYVGDREV